MDEQQARLDGGRGPAAGTAGGQPESRKDVDMNRRMVGAALIALLLAGVESSNAQTAARVEYRNGPLGLAVVIGDLPVRVVRPLPRPVGWVAVDMGPSRGWLERGQPAWRKASLDRRDLRYLLGNDTVKRLERHARNLGYRGTLEGQWYRVDRRTVMLEVTMRGAPVAKFYDHGNDGVFERMFLASPSRPYR